MLHGSKDSLSSRTGWLKPFLVWLAITLRLLFFHVPIRVITRPCYSLWNRTAVRLVEVLPDTYKLPLGALLVVAVILIGGFASPESQDNTRDVLNPRLPNSTFANRTLEPSGLSVRVAGYHRWSVGNVKE